MRTEEDRLVLEDLERRLAALEAAGDAPVAAEVSVGARERVLSAADDAGRFERFVPIVAEMADVPRERAREWLDHVWGQRPRWETAAPGARAWWVEGGPKTYGSLRGFVHLGAGREFPHHKHLGEELVIVLQGGVRVSTGERLRAGDTMRTAGGDEHSFVAVERGPDLLVFTVIHEGLDFGGFVARSRD